MNTQDPSLETPSRPPPAVQLLRVGEQCSRTVRYTREQIAAFARDSGDINLVHIDPGAAQHLRHGRIIASGQQTAAQMMGLASTHCVHGSADGVRDALSLNFNFAFKAPIFADEDVMLEWVVSRSEWNGRQRGWIGHLDGTARAGDRLCIVARGTVLVRPPLSGAQG